MAKPPPPKVKRRFSVLYFFLETFPYKQIDFNSCSAHCQPQTGRAMLRECSSHTMCHVSCVMCHVSPVMCHMSPVTCHLSPLTCNLFFLPLKKLQSGGASPLSTVYCILSTVYCLLSIVYCLLSTVYCLLFTVYCLLSTVYCLLSKSSANQEQVMSKS